MMKRQRSPRAVVRSLDINIRRYSPDSPHLPARDRYLADLFAPLPMRAIVVYRRRRRREWYRQARINTRRVFIRSTWELA